MELWACPDGDVGVTIDRFWSDWPKIHRGTLSSASIQRAVEERSTANIQGEISTQLGNWLRVLDEINGWLIALYIEMRLRYDEESDFDEEEIGRASHNSTNDQFKSALFVLGRIASDGQAIKALTLQGCEYQSRVLLRSTVEHLDLFGSLIEDPKLAIEFMNSGSDLASNAFWPDSSAEEN